MSIYSNDKAQKLSEIVSKEIKLGDFQRLVDGDLAKFGDALIAGKKVINLQTETKARFFNCNSSAYRIEQERITIGDVSFPKPETKAPPMGTEYHFPNFSSHEEIVDRYIWNNDETDWTLLKRGSVHLYEENAVEHGTAMIKLSGGEA